MALGDCTTTYLGEATTSGAVLTLCTGLNLGSNTLANRSGSILVVPIGAQTFIYKQSTA